MTAAARATMALAFVTTDPLVLVATIAIIAAFSVSASRAMRLTAAVASTHSPSLVSGFFLHPRQAPPLQPMIEGVPLFLETSVSTQLLAPPTVSPARQRQALAAEGVLEQLSNANLSEDTPLTDGSLAALPVDFLHRLSAARLRVHRLA